MTNFAKVSQTVAAFAVATVLSAPLSGAFAAGISAGTQDSAITAAVETQLAKNAALEADHLQVQTVDNVVYLHGQVDNAIEQSAAEKIAAQSAGVVRVIDLTDFGGGGN
jgi:osmotically-inducible protein OsmY